MTFFITCFFFFSRLELFLYLSIPLFLFACLWSAFTEWRFINFKIIGTRSHELCSKNKKKKNHSKGFDWIPCHFSVEHDLVHSSGTYALHTVWLIESIQFEEIWSGYNRSQSCVVNMLNMSCTKSRIHEFIHASSYGVNLWSPVRNNCVCANDMLLVSNRFSMTAMIATHSLFLQNANKLLCVHQAAQEHIPTSYVVAIYEYIYLIFFNRSGLMSAIVLAMRWF